MSKEKSRDSDPENVVPLARKIARYLPDISLDIYFDVGANIGQTVRSVRTAFPETKIFAFEPAPDSFAALEQKWGADPLVSCHSLALGSTVATVPMLARGTATTNRIVTEATRADTVDVPMTTGDVFCRGRQIEYVDFLKIDAEGHDMAALLGFSKQLLTGKIGFVEVETGLNPENDRHIPLESFKHVLEAMGYRLFDFRLFRLESRDTLYLRRCNAVFINKALAKSKNCSQN